MFERERLFATLDALAERPGIWVGAPPGAGKTTLVATWLQRLGRRTLWLQLDTADADAATFVAWVDRLVGTAAGRDLGLPPFGPDDVADLTGSLRRRVRSWLEVLPPPWTLVLDNHQEMSADSPLHSSLAAALDELPQGIQWIFISRDALAAPYVTSLARQALGVLEPDLLRCDAGETAELARLHGRPESVEGLMVAQGWVAGMTLMLLGPSTGMGLPTLAARQHLFDYLGAEVLSRMDAQAQRALAAIAYLPSATAEMAVRISDYPGAPALLERLAASNLFTDRRESGVTFYVLHALFGELLRGRFEASAQPDEVLELRRRAGLLLVDAGQTDAGARLLLAAKAWDEAEASLAEAAPIYVAQGRTDALRRLLVRLPPGARARLWYWECLCLLEGDPTAALALLDAAYARSPDWAGAPGDGHGALAAAAAAANALISLGRLAELGRWIGVIDAWRDDVLAQRDDAAELRLVPGLLAALVYHAPWHDLVEPLADRAERLLHLEAAASQRLLVASLAYHLLWRGHTDRLERVLARIDALSAQGRAAPLTMMRWLAVSVMVKTLLGRNADAGADAGQALALVAGQPSLTGLRAGAENMAVLAALGAHDATLAHRHHAWAAAALHPDNAHDRTVFEQHHGMIALLEGDSVTALRLMRAAVASARGSGFRMREHIALIANALAAAQAGEQAEARHLLDEVFAHPFHAICRWHHWVAGSVAAYAALLRGDRESMLGHLRDAYRVARDLGFRHGPMLFCCSDMMARLAAIALENGIEPDVVRDVVLCHDLPAPAEAGPAWPWALRVHTFGRLEVLRGDGPLPASRKESRRLMELLRLLAAHGTTPVARSG